MVDPAARATARIRSSSRTGSPWGPAGMAGDAVRGFLDGDILQVLVYDRVLDEAERTRGRGLPRRPTTAGRPRSSAPAGRWSASRWSPSGTRPRCRCWCRASPRGSCPSTCRTSTTSSIGRTASWSPWPTTGISTSSPTARGRASKTTVERFWENKGGLNAPIGMALTPPGYHLGEGVFVACKGKISLIADVDRDGKADKEIVVATGWKELPHGVDALGVAVDEAGHVYFGLGVTNFTNPYLVDASGEAAYDLKGEHGTIQKVSPDFRKREIIATGIRFPVGAGVQPPRRPLRDRPGGGDLAPQREPVRRAAAHPAGEALRVPAAAPEAPPLGDRRAQRVRLRPAASVDLRPQLQRAGQRRPDLRPGLVGGGCAGHRLLAGQALPDEAGEDRGRLRRAEARPRRPEHAPRRRLRLAAGRPRRRGPQRPAGLGERAEGEGQALQDHATPTATPPSRCSRGPRGRRRPASRSTARSTWRD